MSYVKKITPFGSIPAILLALALSPNVCAAPATSASAQCAALSILLSSKVSYPTSPAYIASSESYFWQQSEQLTPACIISPSSSSDVSKIVGTLTAFHVLKPGSVIASVRGGGHSTVVGAANANGGVTVDLTSLDAVTLNTDKTIVSVGPGARWEEVYTKLDPFNLTASGGRVAGVGVGGYLTGGGISFFSGVYGWAADLVVGIEVVLAGGKVVYATRTAYPDLFSALQGGSNNFGIVTRFDIKTIPQGKFLGGVVVYPISTLEAQQQAFATFINPSNFDGKAAVIQAFVWSAATGPLVSNDIKYTDPVLTAPAIQPFFDIQPQYLNTERVSSVLDFVTEQAALQPSQARGLYANTGFKPTLAVLQAVYSLWDKAIPTVQAVDGLQFSLIFQRTPVNIPGNVNSLGLPSDAGSLVICELSFSWSSAADDALVKSTAQSLIASIEAATKAAGVFDEFLYLNYAASFQDPIGGYGAANEARLQTASEKYDPCGFFQVAVPGGFKLDK